MSTSACFEPEGTRLAATLDTQGHRGARGRFPENTLPAFAEAIRQGMVTLELDLAVSADSQLVVSHEPWFNEAICELGDHDYTEATSLYSLTYDEIARVDCGSLGNKDFPDQEKMLAVKPRFEDVVVTSDSLALSLNRPLPRYNLEIKSKGSYDGEFTPPIAEFTELVYSEITRLGIIERITVQSFDMRPLKLMRTRDASIRIALLSASPLSANREIDDLGFKPDVYSPYHLQLRPEMVERLHKLGIEVVPWTVNDITRMSTLVRWGVDGIISDYPDRLAEIAAKL